MTVFLSEFPTSLGKESSAGQHYMIIESFESLNATTTVDGSGKKLSSIGLYIPAGSLNTSFTGNYEGIEGGETNVQRGQALLARAQVGVGPGGRFSLFTSAALESLVQTFTKSVDSGGFIRAQGLAPNNHLALAYNGPNTFREHTFAFKFFPKNQEESFRVNDIITEFKQGTLPRLSGGGQEQLKDAFFKSPRHHKIKFLMGGTLQDDNTFLFKIGTSVITSMIVNYDPQGTVGFHDNGAPVSVDLSLTFKEITLPISTDAITRTRRNTETSIAGQQAQAANDASDLDTLSMNEARNRGFATTGGPPNKNKIVIGKT